MARLLRQPRPVGRAQAQLRRLACPLPMYTALSGPFLHCRRHQGRRQFLRGRHRRPCPRRRNFRFPQPHPANFYPHHRPESRLWASAPLSLDNRSLRQVLHLALDYMGWDHRKWGPGHHHPTVRRLPSLHKAAGLFRHLRHKDNSPNSSNTFSRHTQLDRTRSQWFTIHRSR